MKKFFNITGKFIDFTIATTYFVLIYCFRVNYVNKFNFSLKSKRIKDEGNSNKDNKFANLWIERTEMKTAFSLPNIVRLCTITDYHTYLVSPLEVAIETMEDKNR